MNDEPDLSFDIDALFEHLGNDLDQDSADEMDWVFAFQSADVAKLQRVAERLAGEFSVQVQEDVEEVDEDGNVSIGDPMLGVNRRGVLTADDVKALASRMADLAAEEGIVYEGVNCFDAIDDDELFAWLDLEEATWRLRHFTDAGLEPDAELPWVFVIVSEDAERLQATAGALTQAGDARVEVFDEPDDEGLYALCLFTDGTNNESQLVKKHDEISALAKQHGAKLIGIQFFSEDDLRDADEIDEEETG